MSAGKGLRDGVKGISHKKFLGKIIDSGRRFGLEYASTFELEGYPKNNVPPGYDTGLQRTVFSLRF
jgi:hypothetical protein